MIGSSLNVAEVARPLAFVFCFRTYLWKSGISTMFLIKTAHRNRLDSQDSFKMCSVRSVSYWWATQVQI